MASVRKPTIGATHGKRHRTRRNADNDVIANSAIPSRTAVVPLDLEER